MQKKLATIARIGLVASTMLPLLASAQATTANIGDILTVMSTLLNTIIPILMILATLIFLWGIISYITAAGDEEKLKSARTYIIWGLVALFVMVSIWGLVTVLNNTFGIQREAIPIGPQQ